MGRKASMWNVYVASLIPYPAQVIPPSPATVRSFRKALRLAFLPGGAAWCTTTAITALGPVWGIRGSPKCPEASARAQGALAHIRGSAWGPAPARRAQGAAWAAVVTWAHDAARHGGPPHVRDLPEHARGAAARVRQIANALAARLPDPLQAGDAAVVYKAAWFAMHFRGYHAWMQQRSAGRRWAPGDGSEWGILSSAATATDAARVLRFLCNGLPGGSRWRPREQRPPRTCSSCADEGVVIAQEAPTRLQSGRIAPGLGWCRGCAGPWTEGQTWACLPDDSLPPQLRPSAARLRDERPGLAHFSGAPSSYGACPLCGSGEAGAEHLWVGCPVTETVWDEFGDGTMP